MIFLGIDPGLSGAIALIRADGSRHSVSDMPTMARGGGRVKHEVDAAGLARLLRPHVESIAFGVVERVGAMPGQGVASMFSLGHSTGTIDGVLACLGIPHQVISPAKWKALAGLPADKGLVLAAARRRWPDASLARVKDHGRAEALFLARVAAQLSGRPHEVINEPARTRAHQLADRPATTRGATSMSNETKQSIPKIIVCRTDWTPDLPEACGVCGEPHLDAREPLWFFARRGPVCEACVERHVDHATKGDVFRIVGTYARKPELRSGAGLYPTPGRVFWGR